MNNILEILSDDNIAVVSISSQNIVKKEIDNFEPATLLIDKSKKILLSCENYQLNPTCFGINSNDQKWEKTLIEELKLSPHYRVNVTDLDNNTDIIEIFSSIRLIIKNYKLLKKEQLKEITCAVAFTPFGSLQLET